MEEVDDRELVVERVAALDSFSQWAALFGGEAGIAGNRRFVEAFILVVCFVGVEDSSLWSRS